MADPNGFDKLSTTAGNDRHRKRFYLPADHAHAALTQEEYNGW
jgi:hypothetical protein